MTIHFVGGRMDGFEFTVMSSVWSNVLFVDFVLQGKRVGRYRRTGTRPRELIFSQFLPSEIPSGYSPTDVSTLNIE